MTALTALEAPPEAPRSTFTRTFGVLCRRDALLLREQLVTFLLRTIMQPLLMTFVFAFVLPSVGSAPPGPAGGAMSFATVLVPGLVAISATTQAMNAAMTPLLIELAYDDIEDRVLAPIPVWVVAAQKIVSAGTQGVLSGALVFPIVLTVHAKGQAPQVHVHNWPLFVVVLLLSGMLAASIGLIFGTAFDAMKANALFMLFALPLMMFGCVYFTWSALHTIRWLQIAVLANPVVYMSEGLRAALTPQVGHMPTWILLLVLTGGLLGLGGLATRLFVRRVLA
ncbi:ABC transporter permease [Actinoallomurus sp. CA-150999]|uniref:ABC transporter permease n=1 Tax=Actinoallomurus sp. CA-150999 TaxID=3239887 RepID=UPI003D8E9E58